MIYVTSDIHGDMRRYNSIMSKINLKAEDKLYVLGDIIDGMPYGIDILLDLMGRKNVTVLLGNHEFMMLNAIQNSHDWSLLNKWLKNEGVSTLKNFVNQSKASQQRIIEYIAQMPTSVDLTVGPKKYLLVHASPLYIWTRLKPTDKMPKGKKVIFGHTPTECYQDKTSLHIWYGEDKIGIDCGSGNVHNACRLACLRLDDMIEFYSD